MSTSMSTIEMEAVAALLELRISARDFNENHTQACPTDPPMQDNLDVEVTVLSTSKTTKQTKSSSKSQESEHLPDGGVTTRNIKLRRRNSPSSSSNTPKYRIEPRKTLKLYRSYLIERREARRILRQKALYSTHQVDTNLQRKMDFLQAYTEELTKKIKFLKS